MHVLGHAVLADPLEHVILGDLTARRQRAPVGGHHLDLPSQRDLLFEQRVPRPAIVGALVGIAEMLQLALLRDRSNHTCLRVAPGSHGPARYTRYRVAA
jgi:hypothetical protein